MNIMNMDADNQSRESSDLYTREFYEYKKGWTHRSADTITSVLLEHFTPQSVVDVGCGTGTWLAAFRNHGISDVLGVDGDYVEESMLEIPRENFLPFDLSKPLQLERGFDLAISLEVAEHLDEAHADNFIDSLTDLAPIVLFSGAIPHQGGVNHVNEQWQDYWADKFKLKDYIPIDAIRKFTWSNNDVAAHYAQNIILYVSRNALMKNKKLETAANRTDIDMLNVVHPDRYMRVVEKNARLASTVENLQEELDRSKDPAYMSLRNTLSVLPTLIKNALSKRI